MLMKTTNPVDRAEAFGRIAFSCPRAEVGAIIIIITLLSKLFQYN